MFLEMSTTELASIACCPLLNPVAADFPREGSMRQLFFFSCVKALMSFLLTTGTIKEILGTAQSVGCSIDGRHPHDIIDDINNGVIECPAVSIHL